MSSLAKFGPDLSVAVIGASGGIGAALVAALEADDAVGRVFALARSTGPDGGDKVRGLELDLTREASIERAAAECAMPTGLDIVLVATGVLHGLPRWRPEKSWDELDADLLAHAFAINCTGPALVAKHFLPLMTQSRRSVFAALSARVGSIGDNRLGGWYGYRASKAALNMTIKTLAIELARKNPRAACIGLHPGTVDTGLSAPFQRRLPDEQIFTPERAARQLIEVVASTGPDRSGCVIAWDGQIVTP